MTSKTSPESIIQSIISPIFNEIELGIALVDSNGIIQWVNKIMETWFTSLGDLVLSPCENLCQNKSENCCIEAASANLGKKIATISNTNQDGQIRHFEITTYPINDLPTEKYSFIMLVRETTDHEQSAQTLQQSDARFQAIIDSTLAGIALTDLEGNVLYANQESLKMFGYQSHEEIFSLSGANLVADERKANIKPILNKLRKGKQIENLITKMTRKDGTPISVRLSATSLKDKNGQPYQLLITLQDITEKIQAEKTQDAIYKIASAAGSDAKLDEIYPTIHKIIQGIMPANNFYIALLDKKKNTISFPYFVDEKDPPPPDRVPFDKKSLTAYILRSTESLLCTQEVSDELEKRGEIELVGTAPAIWLGAPLIVDKEPIGVIAMQHYKNPDAYTKKDQRILEFVSTEVAKAIQNKRIEYALKESEKRFRNIVEASPLGLHLYRLMPDDRLIFMGANQSADNILGIDCSKLVGKTIDDAFPPLLDTNVPDAYRKVAAGGGTWQDRQVEYKDENIEGGYDIFAFQTSPNEMAVIFLDITERLHTESALIESEKRFRSVVESSPLGIFIYHLTEKNNLVFIESNQAADEILGVDSQRFIGKKIEEVFPALANTEMPSLYRKIASNGGVWHNQDIRYIDDAISGAYEVFAFQISPMRVAVMYQDITNRLKNEEEITRLNEELEERVARRTAELEAANREMEAFAYSVSHDLRAPVRSIKGFSELLQQDNQNMSDEETAELLQRIYQSSIKMDRLIDDLLALSYLENQELEIQTINLSQLVKNISAQLIKEYPNTHINLNIQDTPPTRADQNMVHIMLTNLLTNAYKFTANIADPEITFGSQDHQGQITYYLQDNGIGFEMQYADKIFAPFERLHSSEYEGTGIGLAIVRRVIQRHKGRIWAVSDLDKGATFYFSFGTSQSIT